jgi:phage portal protein BeeE
MRVFPQMVMHSDKTSTFASAESFFLAHVTHSLQPWITRWEHTLEHSLLADEDDLVVKFNLAALLRGTPTERGQFYLNALGGSRAETAWMTRNEVRALEDLDPIDGGDELPVPLNPDGTPPGGKPPVVTDKPTTIPAKAA